MLMLMLLITTVGLAMENKQVEQKAVLSGTVTTVITEGSTVKVGDSLVEYLHLQELQRLHVLQLMV